MAGFYADVPGHKMALDKDGSQWFRYTSAWVGTPLTAGEITTVNDWTDDGPNPGNGGAVAVIFPEKRDIAGVNVHTFHGSNALNTNYYVETSPDTTNGVDGTWSTAATFLDAENRLPVSGPAGRAIRTVAVNGVRGVRARSYSGNSSGGVTLHVYGSPSSGPAVDRLAFWHPTLDQELVPAALDWGDIARGTNETRTVRVKNLSGSKTANTPRVALDALTDTTPSVVGQHALSVDNSTWLAQVNLSSLAPGAVSPVVYLKRTTSLTAAPSLWSIRAFAEATTWS